MDGCHVIQQSILIGRLEISCRDLAQLPVGPILLIGQEYDDFLAVGGGGTFAPELTGRESVGYRVVVRQSAELDVTMEFSDRTGFWVRNL